MLELKDKSVLVIGLGVSGVAATRLLLARGAHVVAVDGADSATLREQAAALRREGARVELGTNAMPRGTFELAVISPGVPLSNPVVQESCKREIPFVGELELGYQQCLALNISITGTNGKTTTTELTEKV